MRRYLLFPLAAIVLTAACKDIFDVRPGSWNWLSEQRVSAGASGITVMTQNLYVGADVDAVIVALGTPDPNDDLPALLFAIQTVAQTDFPARAGAIADEIAARRPHVVGLQEASKIDIDLTSLGVPVVIHQDFVAILEAKLAERGLHYGVAATVQNIVAAPLPGISLVDHDVMLVDLDRVTVTASGGQNFTYNVGVVAPGIELKRGWVWADATIDDIGGVLVRFVSTHPEADLAGNTFGALRAAQVGEIVASQPADRPAVIMGDLNDVPGSPMYQLLAGAGYTDSWRALRPGVIGFTCCERPDLSNQLPDLGQRIDYVFARGMGGGAAGLRGQIDRFGDVPADRVAGAAYPVWPSDHAGLVATLR